jgi:hypothetical protein
MKSAKFVLYQAKSMNRQFEPFTPESFKQHTGLNAFENEAIYVRWVNTQINYANYLQMQMMNTSLQEIISFLKEGAMVSNQK